MTPDELDAEITRALKGSASDPLVARLAAELRSDPSPRLRRRIARRRWSPAQLAAAVLGGMLFWHGISAIVLGRWIANGVGEPYSAHVSFEGGLAMIAIGGAAFACLLRRDWLPITALTAVPLGLAYGVHGLSEVTVFAWGAAFHVTEGLTALAVLVILWRTSRYRSRRIRKEQV